MPRGGCLCQLSCVLRWGHESRVACHPGVRRSLTAIHQRFWWPSMAQDVRQFMLACSVCTQNKTSNRSPVGLLWPLPIPSRPWSHLALEFVTGLPPSRGNTVILFGKSSVDRSGPQRVCLQVFTLRPTGRQSEPTRISSELSAAWRHIVRHFLKCHIFGPTLY